MTMIAFLVKSTGTVPRLVTAIISCIRQGGCSKKCPFALIFKYMIEYKNPWIRAVIGLAYLALCIYWLQYEQLAITLVIFTAFSLVAEGVLEIADREEKADWSRLWRFCIGVCPLFTATHRL